MINKLKYSCRINSFVIFNNTRHVNLKFLCKSKGGVRGGGLREVYGWGKGKGHLTPRGLVKEL